MLFVHQRPTFIASEFFLLLFEIPVVLAPNIGTLMIARFLSSALGVAPATNTGGTIHDLWVRDESGPAIALYTVSTVTSPAFTTMVTGYLIQDLGSHWDVWIWMIVVGATFVMVVVGLPETRHTLSLTVSSVLLLH